jgi:hypothetical protein
MKKCQLCGVTFNRAIDVDICLSCERELKKSENQTTNSSSFGKNGPVRPTHNLHGSSVNNSAVYNGMGYGERQPTNKQSPNYLDTSSSYQPY